MATRKESSRKYGTDETSAITWPTDRRRRFVAGIIARFLSPGPNRPKGFILTTGLGIAGAFVATFIGQTIGWYRLDQGAGLIGATVGALLVLFIWNRLVAHRVPTDPGTPRPPRRWL